MSNHKKKLKLTKQCVGCPWKKSVDISTIPNGYDHEAHTRLLKAHDPHNLNILRQQQVMACHHSNDSDEMFCVGYLYNQLGVGNNIALRVKIMNYDNAKELTVEGEQHEQFADLIPENLRNSS